MKTLAVATMLAALACGGSSQPAPVEQTPQAQDAGVQSPTLQKPGTYKAPASGSANALSAPVGRVDTTLIATGSGEFAMVLPNYDIVRGAMAVGSDGSLVVGTGASVVSVDGGVSSAGMVGKSDGGTISGSVKGSETFEVSQTTIQDQSFTIAQMAGNYLSSSSSNGLWIALTLTPDSTNPAVGYLLGYTYDTQADAQAGDITKAVGRYYSGAINHAAPPANSSFPDTPNSFSVGLAYQSPPTTGPQGPSTSGYAYFTTGGLFIITSNAPAGLQLTAYFLKQ
jgi:hypothetical protein